MGFNSGFKGLTMLQQISLREYGGDTWNRLCGWGYGQMAGCCIPGNELLGSINCGEFL